LLHLFSAKRFAVNAPLLHKGTVSLVIFFADAPSFGAATTGMGDLHRSVTQLAACGLLQGL
jgi:hypothetical protein